MISFFKNETEKEDIEYNGHIIHISRINNCWGITIDDDKVGVTSLNGGYYYVVELAKDMIDARN